MAGAYSQPYQYDQYHQQYPVELIGKAMMYKQEKYDANRAKVQDFLNTFANMDLVKEEDKQHFANNINTLLQAVNASGGGDLSKAGVSDQLIGNLSQAADDTVVNGFVGTQQFRTYQAKWDKIKQDKPDEYNEANYQYGLQNFNAWVNDGKAGTKLSSHKNDWHGAGIGQVTPYVDTIEELQKSMKTIDPKITVVRYGTGWQFVNEKHEVVTSDAITQMVDLKMQDSKFANQVRIDTWSKYGQANDEVLKKVSTQYLEQEKSTLASTILQLKNKALTAKDPSALNADIQYNQKLISQIDGKLADIPNNFEKVKVGLSLDMQQAELKSRMVGIYAKDNITDIDYATDEQRKAIGEHALRADELRLKASLDDAVNKKNAGYTAAVDVLKTAATGNLGGAQLLAAGLQDVTGVPLSGILDNAVNKTAQVNLGEAVTGKPISKYDNLVDDATYVQKEMQKTGIQNAEQARQILMDKNSTPASITEAKQYQELEKAYLRIAQEQATLTAGFTKETINDIVFNGRTYETAQGKKIKWQHGHFVEQSIVTTTNSPYRSSESAPTSTSVVYKQLSAKEVGQMLNQEVQDKSQNFIQYADKNAKITTKLFEGHQINLVGVAGLNILNDLRKVGVTIPTEIATTDVNKYEASLNEKNIKMSVSTRANGTLVFDDGSGKTQEVSGKNLPASLKNLVLTSQAAQPKKLMLLGIDYAFNAAERNPSVKEYREPIPPTAREDGYYIDGELIYKPNSVSCDLFIKDATGNIVERIPINPETVKAEGDRYDAVIALRTVMANKLADRRFYF